ncbi:MAG: hypothetical protein AAF623_14500 [Planctomycetota bacterium]
MTNEDDARLSLIQTQWTLMGKAHGDAPSQQARSQLLIRYYGPITKYVIAILRNNGVKNSQLDEMAIEFCNRFSLKFLEGAFHSATPEKGKFRSYVKTAIKHEIWKYLKESRELGGTLPSEVAEFMVPEEDLDGDWRKSLLEQGLVRLQEEFPRYYAFLKLRQEMPEASAQLLADQYHSDTGEKVSKANVRKLIERARKKFSWFIFEDVCSSIEDPNREKVTIELQTLRLTKYCQAVLDDKFPV